MQEGLGQGKFENKKMGAVDFHQSNPPDSLQMLDYTAIIDIQNSLSFLSLSSYTYLNN